jgi:hypothetical protein
MKTLLKLKHLFMISFIPIGAMFFQSCAVNNIYHPQLLTVHEIVQMSKDGVSSKDIISEIRNSHTGYNLKADQLANLRNEGVQDSVINYMEMTHMEAVRKNQQMSDEFYMGPGYGYGYGPYYGYGFGWPYGYWGWDIGPTIIFRGGGDFHGGGFHGGGFHGGGGMRGGRH